MRRAAFCLALSFAFGMAYASAQEPAEGAPPSTGGPPAATAPAEPPPTADPPAAVADPAGTGEAPDEGAANPAADENPLPQLAGKVTGVTLYRGQAMVTRTIPVALAAGAHEIVVPNLPPQVQPDSLFAEGTDAIEVRAVRYRERAAMDSTDAKVKTLQAEIDDLNRTRREFEMQVQVVQRKLAYLDSMSTFSTQKANENLEAGKLDVQALTQLSTFAFEQRDQAMSKELELQFQIEETQKQIELAQRKLGELASAGTNSVREAVLFVQKANDAEGELRLSYLVSACGWSPSYVVRSDENGADAAADAEPAGAVELEYSALIHQTTGEDWNDVELTLSTATPALSSASPGLAPFRVTLTSRTDPNAEAQVAQMPMGKAFAQQFRDLNIQQQAQVDAYANTVTLGLNIDANWRVNDLANGIQCLELTADQKSLALLRQASDETADGPSLSYTLATPVSLASRSDQQMVRIHEAQLQATLYYVANPVLTNYVYREADVLNTSPVDLLSGPVSVYLGGKFVGKTEIPTVARGQAFVVGFGIDPQLRANRELVEKTESVQGGNEEQELNYRVTLENFKGEDATVRVYDRIPTSDDSMELRVTLGEVSQPISAAPLYVREERPRGILRWDVDVPARKFGENAVTIEYSYRLEFDRSLMISAEIEAERQRQEFEELQRGRLRR
jgi:hypothetical protein